MALGLLAAFAAQAAVIYKWVDADGVVHYSDQAFPGAEKIHTSSPSGPGAQSSRAADSSPASRPPAAGGPGYSEFSITSPANDQTFFGDDVVQVALHLEPELKDNHALTWHLNGKELDAPPNPAGFSLPRLARGAYTIAATVIDQNTGASQTSNTVTFFVRQPSALSPQHK